MKKILFLILCSFSLFSNAQIIIGRQTAIIVKTSPYPSGTANALLWLPDDYDTTNKKDYPIIIHLHGVGETGTKITDLSKLLNNSIPQRIANGWNPQAISPVDGKLYKFIVVSPQAADWSFGEQQLKYILPDLEKRYKINPKRVYIAGMSAGGSCALSCITVDTAFCKLIAAIAPMSAAPVENPQNLVNAATYNVPVWDIINDVDRMGFTPTNISYVNIINNAFPKTTAKITLVPGYSHSSCNQGYDPFWYDSADPKKLNLYEWFLQYKKKK